MQAGRRRSTTTLGRVTKPRIIEAVREAKGDATAVLIEHLKKGDMAREAERLLAGTGWLPEPLRLPVAEAERVKPTSKSLTCPTYLADDGRCRRWRCRTSGG
jgi:ParB family chromosome partitioning protein